MNPDISIISYQLIHATLRSSAPIVLAVTGAIISKQANVFNIAIEGIMLFAAFTAISVSAAAGSWIIALAAAVAVGAFIAALIGIAHLKFNSNILVLGFSVNALALGGTRLLLEKIYGRVGSYTPMQVSGFPVLNIGVLAGHPVLKSLFSGYSIMEIAAYVMILLLWYVLYKTRTGLRLRSAGFNETAAKAAGVDVYRTKMNAIIISGVFAGIAGAHLSLGYTNMFSEGMTNGRGFMANAAMNFGGGNPINALLGSLLFGFSDSIGSRLQSAGLPSQFVLMLPYAVTVAVLTISMIGQQNKEKRQKLKESEVFLCTK